MEIKKIVGKVVSRQKILGFCDFLRFKKLSNPWGGAFNGQKIRTAIATEILKQNQVELIVETGTFRGTTTAFLLNFGKDVFTCEFSPRNYSFSYFRFFRNSKLHIYNRDSRDFLRKISEDRSVIEKLTFFYLDAHWDADLPLKEELEIIDGAWKRYIIMIDDFQVPGDSGYRFDDYGGESVLNEKYVSKTGITYYKFYPISSAEETGAKSGSIILTTDSQIAERLRKNSFLRERA